MDVEENQGDLVQAILPGYSSTGYRDPLLASILAYNEEASAEDELRCPERPVAEEPNLLADMEQDPAKWAEYFDTVSGTPLDPGLVHAAQQEELDYMRSLPTWEPIDRLEPGDKPVSCKWVLSDKGPGVVRARLVACETKWFAPAASEFAATPPLEALRVLISLAASSPGLYLDFLDVRKAHLNGIAKRRVVIKIPPEAGGGYGLLQRTLYGTRDAASAWNTCIQSELVDKLGFRCGKTSPCLFHHPTRGIRLLIHGDDFVCLGTPQELYQLRQELESVWLMKFRGMLGVEVNSLDILNRVIRVTSTGIEFEADPKHARLLAERLGLSGKSNGVTTPGEHSKSQPGDEEKLPEGDRTYYRSLTMRAAYLSLDRPDIAFAVKELARGMAEPTRGDLRALRRLGRFLVREPKLIQYFAWQSLPSVLSAECDSDFAGCRQSRKSTSGFIAMLGKHCIGTKCRHQSTIALSSGEAEFYASVSAISRAIGLKQLLGDWSIPVSISLGMDATAAISMQTREGLGKAKHIHVQYLWAQAALGPWEISLVKVKTTANRADLLTKHLARATVENLVKRLNYDWPKKSG